MQWRTQLILGMATVNLLVKITVKLAASELDILPISYGASRYNLYGFGKHGLTPNCRFVIDAVTQCPINLAGTR